MIAPAPAQANPAPNPVPNPLRITTLSLCDFRAFPNPVTFDLAGRNLLVYGENGAGKSSLFLALRHFFAMKPPTRASVKNVFSERPAADFSVTVSFNDGTPAVTWSSTRHPTALPSDARVAEAALRKSCLDYRALLDTNYIHGSKRPNLFDITVSTLLADFSVPTAGGAVKTISELWADVERAKPWKHGSSLDPVQAACITFNTGFRLALDALHPQLVTLVQAMMPGQPVTVNPFTFGGITYQHNWFKRDRVINGQELFPEISFNGKALPIPQTFLNEARLSAFALAMYLGGRLACVPAGGDRLKLLVLDDVLIGLDHDNRVPVLQLLQGHFDDWQVVVLTHDRVWYEMARQFHDGAATWTWAEIYADGDGGRATPTVLKPNAQIVAEALDECTRHLNANALASAATSARRAFEWALKRFCEKKHVPVPFVMQQKDNDTNVLMTAIGTWTAAPGQKRAQVVSPILANLRMYRTGVLNPQTHAAAPNPVRQEVEGAMAAIRALEAARIDQTIR